MPASATARRPLGRFAQNSARTDAGSTILAGHSARGTTARHYEHLSPSYLKAAIVEVDAYFVELGKLTSAIKGPSA